MEEPSADLYLDQKPGRTATVEGKEYLFFSGYNYLGINADEEFIALVAEGTAKYGWLFPSARISNTRLAVYEECEDLLSEITGSEATVLLPSGFAAGRVASSYLGGAVNNAPGSHPAILQHKSQINDFNDWRNWLLSQPANAAKPLIIASDSVNPLTSTVHNFSFLRNMSAPVMAVLDDSHGMGIIGENGSGISSLVPRTHQVNYLFTYSLSKAFGISGGAISCSKEQVQHFKTTPEYSAVTPMSPAQVFAFIKGQHIYSRQRQKLMDNIAYFENCVKDLPGIQHQAGLPVFVLPAFIDESIFINKNILISSFAYPDPKGKMLKRIVLNALHTPDDLDFLTLVLQSAYQASA
jgi:7-keto-8-aminopelargonate synthetase-like enzyme